MSEEVLSEIFRFADVAFREFAAKTAANEGTPFEDAYKRTWQLYELGHLKLVGGGGRLGVQACINRAERSAIAKQNRPLAAYWRRTVLAAQWRETDGSKPSVLLNNPRWLTRMLTNIS